MWLLNPFPFTLSPSPQLRTIDLMPVPQPLPLSHQWSGSTPFSKLLSLLSTTSTWFIVTVFFTCSPLASTLCWPFLAFSGSAVHHSLSLSFSALLFFFYYDSCLSGQCLLVPERRLSQCWQHAFLSFSITVFSNPMEQNMLFHPSRLFLSCLHPFLMDPTAVPNVQMLLPQSNRERNLSERVLIHRNREDEI